jgi:hypothetical protein
MSDITLSGGREIDIDLGMVSLREHRALFDPQQPQADEDATACKMSGLSLDEYLDLSIVDQKRLWAAYFKKVRNPLADPNLPGASISD